jgi:agmatinase
LPLLYNGKVTVGDGAFRGPKEIIKASYELEYFDCDLKIEPYLNGIHTLKEINFLKNKEDFFKVSEKISDAVFKNISFFKFPIILGSDHSTTFPVISAFEKIEKDFGIIVLDAHSDLREEWGKDTWHHACVSRYISKNHKTLIAGVRSQDFYENDFLKTKDGKNVSVIYADNLHKSLNDFKKQLKKLPKKIFLSIDVDFFDPSIIKNTNTPEPGGFNWNQTMEILNLIFKEKEIIGADIVEFSPKGDDWNFSSESYFLAKLVYKIIAYKFK